MVSYARSTYEKAKQFNEKLQKLQETIKPITIRTYLSLDNEEEYKNIELNLGLTEAEKIQLDELKNLRMSGIQAEMKYAIAQAEKSGIQLSEDIISGKSITIGFNKELLNKVPSLGVYELFMVFTVEELEEYLSQIDR